MDYPARVYHFSLPNIGLAVSLLVLVTHLIALVRPAPTQRWLQKLPRSRIVGIALIILAALWSFWLAAAMDLGEFSGFRRLIEILIPVLTLLTIVYADDFLAARALGILALLAAEPILSAAFLQPQVLRLLLVVLAYAWLTAGMFWVGKPYLLRDQITWLTANGTRWRLASGAGVAYGVVALIVSLTAFR